MRSRVILNIENVHNIKTNYKDRPFNQNSGRICMNMHNLEVFEILNVSSVSDPATCKWNPVVRESYFQTLVLYPPC